MSENLNIVIGSAGRRLYLLRWFREAMAALNLSGKIIVTESDSSSAAFTAGDEGVLMPRYSDARYEECMLRMIEDHQPAMFLSVNDWELAKLGEGLGDELRSRGVIVPGLADADIAKVTDKYQLQSILKEAGIPTPQTVIASDRNGVRDLKNTYSRLVVKDRWGSGSSGLQIVDSAHVDSAIKRIAQGVSTSHLCIDVLDEIVVQPFIHGMEYGIDVVGTFADSPNQSFRVLARKKIRMRAGETDKAETVAPEDFSATATCIGNALMPTGLIDVDVLRDSNGELHVIDINPRFGGGYPFVHLAGANVPLYYVASLTDRSIGDEWATYKAGVVSAKFEEVRVSG